MRLASPPNLPCPSSGGGSRRFFRMKEGCMKKAIGGSFARTIQKTDENEDQRRDEDDWGSATKPRLEASSSHRQSDALLRHTRLDRC
jgi:hypothetical protein